MAGLPLMFRRSCLTTGRECKFHQTVNNFVVLTFIRGRKPIHAYILQVMVVANHMNGKDTHVRGLRVLGPAE